MQTVKFNVGGDGLWSSVQGSVEIVDMRLGYIADDKEFGELCVYFNDKHWDVNIDGLIYTDETFLNDLRQFLVLHNLPATVDYSEQGMQGDDYVSLDVEGDFISAWERKFNVVLEVE